MQRLLDAARLFGGCKSDRELARLIGANDGAVHIWRSGKALPSDDNVLRMCKICGFDPLPWLLELNAARTNGPARQIYAEAALKLNKPAA